MTRTLRAGIAGVLISLAGTGSAVAATVTVRAEGAAGPLVRQVAVQPSSAVVVNKDGATCDGNSGAGALELATNGDWTGHDPGFGLSVDRIRSEAHQFGSGVYWGFLVNDVPASTGVCDYVPQEGDELVFDAECETPAAGCFTGGALDIAAPGTARPGQPFTVTVEQVVTSVGGPPDYKATTTRSPASGARVADATSGTDGRASVTVNQRGPVELVATRQQQIRDEATVCVTDGADGYCGTTAPVGTPPPPPSQAGTAPVAPVATAPDRTAPEGRITGIREGQRFKRHKAPRKLEASVSDPSGILQVKLSLSRQVGHRCWVFSGKHERFRRSRCGHHPVFKVGDRGDVSYLLPKRLRRGRYVLDLIATDKALNRDTLARGRSRVVFRVR